MLPRAERESGRERDIYKEREGERERERGRETEREIKRGGERGEGFPPGILQQAFCTLHPTSYTLHLHPTPYTIHPTTMLLRR